MLKEKLIAEVTKKYEDTYRKRAVREQPTKGPALGALVPTVARRAASYNVQVTSTQLGK